MKENLNQLYAGNPFNAVVIHGSDHPPTAMFFSVGWEVTLVAAHATDISLLRRNRFLFSRVWGEDPTGSSLFLCFFMLLVLLCAVSASTDQPPRMLQGRVVLLCDKFSRAFEQLIPRGACMHQLPSNRPSQTRMQVQRGHYQPGFLTCLKYQVPGVVSLLSSSPLE